MKHLYKLSLFLTLLFPFCQAFGQVVNLDVSPASLQFSGASGDTVDVILTISNSGNATLDWDFDFRSATIEGTFATFEKLDFADPTLAENQDRISSDFILTRGNSGGIFNIVRDGAFNFTGPTGSSWAGDPTIEADSYDTWRNNAGPRTMDFFDFNNIYSMRLDDERRFFDVQFLSWTSNGDGGGFSYNRRELFLPLFSSSDTGSVAAGESQEVTISADLSNIPVGTYQMNLLLTSNATQNANIEIPVTITVSSGTPILAVSNATIDFSTTVVGATAEQTIQIFNDGTETLTISDITSNVSIFSASPTALTIAPYETAEVVITAAPTATGAVSGMLSFTSNDDSAPNIAVSVEGQTPPEINIDPTSLSLSFATGAANQATFTVENTGQGVLDYDLRVEATSTTEVLFEKASFANFTLPENQDRFTPGVILTRGDSRGLFNIAAETEFDRNTRTSPAGTSWTGSPTSASSLLDYGTWNNNASPSNAPNFFSFNNVYSMRLEDENRFFDVQILSWVRDGNGGGFSYSRREFPGWLRFGDFTTTSGTVAATSSETITLDIADLLPGAYEANIIITSNDIDEGEIILPVTVTITGGMPSLASNTPDLAFGDVITGNSATAMINVVNDGNANLELTNIMSNAPEFTSSVTSLNIAPGGGGENFEVTFNPSTTGPFTGDLTFTTNDASNPTITIPLTGSGIGIPTIVLGSAPTINDMEAGNSASFTINVENSGDSDLNGNIRITLPDATTTVFEKGDFVDPLSAENQDRINNNVFITRGVQRGLFNAALESEFDRNNRVSPLGTEWAFGATGEVESPDYSTWNNNASPNNASDFFQFQNIYSLRLIDENRYFDVQMLSWSIGDNGEGGGFSYARTESAGWVNPDQTQFSIASGTNEDLLFNIDTEDFIAGTYPARIVFESNDPANPSVFVDVQITLTGTPEISTVTSIDFGDVFINNSSTQILAITNSGTDDLVISSISSDNADFTVSTSNITLLANQTQDIEVALSASAAGVVDGVITINSNDPNNNVAVVSVTSNATAAPDIDVTPSEISITAFPGDIINEPITISNQSGSQLNWTLDSQPNPATQSLEEVLSGINGNIDALQNAIPSRFTFAYDGDGDDINDGGDDMYDGGNRMSTDISGTNIQYSDNEIVDGSNFTGAGTRYFTRHLDGMFIFASDLNGVNTFAIDGNLGADGGGSVDGFDFNIDFLGSTYTAFVKRVYNAGDPSINHMIIAENTNGALLRTFSTNTNDDNHEVTGLSGTTRIYHILYAGANGFFIDDASAMNIANVFLESILDGNQILSSLFQSSGLEVDITSGSLAATESDIATLTLDFDQLALEGNFNFDIAVFSNDPDEAEVVIPVSLSLGGVVNTAPIADVLINEGFASFDINSLQNNFEDANGDNLTFTAVSSNEAVATVDVSGTTLTVTEVSIGMATISVAASDGNGNTGFTNFDLRINAVSNITPIENQSFNVGFASTTIDISNVFMDDDESDVLTITATNADDNIVSINLDSNVLTITEQGAGTSVITLSAQDGFGGDVQTMFDFKVNTVPVVAAAITDQVELEGFGSTTIDLSAVFSDADAGDAITITAVSSDENIVTTSVDGTILTVTEQGVGTSVITLSAQDGFGGDVQTMFDFKVNTVPVVAAAITDQVELEGFGSTTIDLSAVFSDADAGDAITITAVSSDENIVTTSVDGSILTVTEQGVGTASITLTADDGFDGMVTSAFNFTVEMVTSLSFGEFDGEIKLFPNPAEDNLTLILNQENASRLKVTLTDVLGQRVRILFEGASQSLNETVSIRDLTQGTYIMLIETEEQTFRQRIIKQ